MQMLLVTCRNNSLKKTGSNSLSVQVSVVWRLITKDSSRSEYIKCLCDFIISDSKMLRFVDVTLVPAIPFFVCQIQTLIVVDRIDQNLTTVPPNVDVNMERFNLKENHIEEIDSLSFTRYTKMEFIILDWNPLRIIGENTFAQNKYLWVFQCISGNIESLPVNFGSCVPTLEGMNLQRGFNPIAVSTIFKYPYFEAFTSLGTIGLSGLPLKSTDSLKLPPSIRTWSTINTGLAAFPNITSSAYPKLGFIALNSNPQIKVIPDDVWEQVSDNLHTFQVSMTGLSTMVDLTLKKNLKQIVISNNHLETIPDLLNMTLLIKLFIARNSRMTCDHRMCWRRLWDRMRAPLASSDDVTCVQPPELAGYKLSGVNPKLMGCMGGIMGVMTNILGIIILIITCKFILIYTMHKFLRDNGFRMNQVWLSRSHNSFVICKELSVFFSLVVITGSVSCWAITATHLNIS